MSTMIPTAGAAASLIQITPGPTRVQASSASSGWSGLLLEKHMISPGERAASCIDRHVVSVLTGQSSRFEYRDPSGRFIDCLNRTGAVTIQPAGLVPDLRLHTPSEMLHCALEPGFVRGVLDEMEDPPGKIPAFRPGAQDKSIRSILHMLLEELEAETRSSRLFVDSLAYALATRYLLLDRVSGVRLIPRVSALPARILKRVREKIETNLDSDLTLGSLAQDSGYSRTHFLRMFRVATGMTPHQYILELRVARAQDCLKQKNVDIIDIAASCGFSSQSHMTSVFRQRLLMTPAEFRRTARDNMIGEFVA